MGVRNLSLRRKVTTTNAEAISEKTEVTRSMTMMTCIWAADKDILRFYVASLVPADADYCIVDLRSIS